MAEDLARWFLLPRERGNPRTTVDRHHPDVAWTEGNRVEPLIHGRPYFERLHRALCALDQGDYLHFTDWRADPDQLLEGDASVAQVIADLAERGVGVRAMLWESHSEHVGFQLEQHLELARRANNAGAKVVLDQRVRRAGSHHQKLVLLRHAAGRREDLAFVGGIDLCHGRRDDRRHLGDPQPERMDRGYGPTPPWHDVMMQIRGPAVDDLTECFRERWEDPSPAEGHRSPWRVAIARSAREPEDQDRLPDAYPQPPGGTGAVQVLRTYPAKHPPYPFAPHGERSIVRAYRKAFRNARRLIYVEDQYFWSHDVADLFVDALRRAPELKIIVIVPRIPDRNGVISGPAHRIARIEVLERLREAGEDRVAVYDLENDAGTPIYVHAKCVVIDDVWAAVGSDNLNRRSWTLDSELTCAVLDAERDTRDPTDPAGLGDGARVFARDLRLELMREHLQTETHESLLEPDEAFEAFRDSARALDAWHRSGRLGERPLGRLRPHTLESVRWWEIWAKPLYLTLVDPDGRPRSMKRAGRF